MDKYKVNITDTAFEDLKSIALYIREELKEPIVAKNLIAKIKTGIFSLDNSPCRHGLVRDNILSRQGYRPLYVENYVVFYIVSEENKHVDVSRVLYARRNWINIL